MAEAPNNAPGIATPAPAADTGPVATPEFNSGQLQSMRDHLVNVGKLTPEQGDAALRLDGVEPNVQPTPEEVEYDRNYPRAESPAQYEMPRINPELGSKEAAALDRTVRGALYEAGFDRERGSALWKAADKAIATFSKLNPAEQQLHNKRELAKLEKLWGNDTQKKLKEARALVGHLDGKHPGIMGLMDAGAGSDVMVLSLLASQAQIFGGRMRLKQK